MNIRVFLLFFICLLQAKDRIPENLQSECILETRQIKIPGYPNAFNPSIIPYKDGYLLSFRIRAHLPHIMTKYRLDASFIGVAKLDRQFNVIAKSVQLLDIVSYDAQFSFHAEDGRLFKAGERIFLIFNDLPSFQSLEGFAMYLGELIEEKGWLKLKGPALPLKYPHAISIEKNWTPFVLENRVFLIYSDQPRILLEPDINTGDCREIVRTDVDIDWKFGRIRGGTPACLIDDLYVTFYHTRVTEENQTIHYVVGAYAFETHFPFAIREITPFPIGDRSYYAEENSKKVVYPGGMMVQGDKIYVAWGKNDNAAYLTALDKKKLFALMKGI